MVERIHGPQVAAAVSEAAIHSAPETVAMANVTDATAATGHGICVVLFRVL